MVEVAAGSSKKADWIPTFVDYLYLSTTNSSAFSPTDTMPLTSRAKILMGVQATAALITSLLVIARAVGALGIRLTTNRGAGGPAQPAGPNLPPQPHRPPRERKRWKRNRGIQVVVEP